MTRTCGLVGTYAAGCRCDDCRAAATAYARKRRQRDLPLIGPVPDFPARACGPATRHLFFDPVHTPEAKAVCRTCVHQTECRRWAVDHPDTYGVWGGTTTKERDQMRTRKKATT